jgi:hypothetical protein
MVNIEYFVAFQEFATVSESPTEDWIASICEVAGLDSNIGLIAALFNGTVEYHTAHTQQTTQIKAKIHESAIKSVKTLPS